MKNIDLGKDGSVKTGDTTVNNAGVSVVETDSTGTDFGTVTFHLVPADNSNGYIITQKTN